jgi:acetyl-CoA carboxylase biotin carboxylase subunit
MRRALNEYVVTGVKTTIPFHIRVMNNRHFLEGNFDTNFIDKVFFPEERERELPHFEVAVIAAAIQLYLDERMRAIAQRPGKSGEPASMWKYSTRPGIPKIQ